MKNKLSNNYNFFTLIKFSIPSIIAMLFMSMYTMIDGIFVSNLVGTDALAAVNIVFPISSVIYGISIMLSTGSSAVIANKMGKGMVKEAKEDFSFTIIFGTILALLISIFCYLYLESIIYFLGADKSIYNFCYEYQSLLLLFIVPMILQLLFQMYFITAGKPILGMTITILGGITNIVLDYVFISYLNMGIRGAALATGIGFCIPTIFGFLWFSLKRDGSLYFIKPVIRKEFIIKILGNGSSEMITNLSSALITYFFNIMMMKFLGADGVAAVTIVLYSEYLLVALYLGYSNGISPILSYNHGNGNKKQLKNLFEISKIFLLVSSFVIFVLAIVFAEKITMMFTSRDNSVFFIAVHGFRLYAISYLFKGINIFSSSLFTALSNGLISAILSVLRTLVFILIGIVLLPIIFKSDGIWLSVPFAELLSFVLSFYFLRKQFNNFGKSRLD